MRISLLVPAALGAALAATGRTQVSARDQVVGWSFSSNQVNPPGQIDLQDIDNQCAPAKLACSRVLQGNSQTIYAGGTAWDSARQAVWVSDGTAIAAYSLPDCKQLCLAKAQIMDSKAVVTGLAVLDSGRRLLQLESAFGYVGLRSYDIRGCPPVPLRDGCSLQIQSNAIAAGLAYDEARDLVYFTESFPAFVGWISSVHVARAGNKCKPVCKFGLRSCGTPAQGWGPVHGLAYQSCSKRLYASDGQLTSTTSMDDPLNCRITHLSCCARQANGAYRGLAVIPGWSRKTVGTSCLPKGCPFCQNMKASLAGEPSIGNPGFGFRIEGGPSQSFGLLILGAGCGAGIQLPFCGSLYPLLAPPPLFSPPVQLAGNQCAASAHLPVPLPPAGGLCGLQLCCQWAVFCGAVFGVSDAIEFKLVGS